MEGEGAANGAKTHILESQITELHRKTEEEADYSRVRYERRLESRLSLIFRLKYFAHCVVSSLPQWVLVFVLFILSKRTWEGQFSLGPPDRGSTFSLQCFPSKCLLRSRYLLQQASVQIQIARLWLLFDKKLRKEPLVSLLFKSASYWWV